MILILLCFAVLAVFIIYSPQCIPFASDALLKCITIVIPSIFPFMVITEFLSKTDFYCRIERKFSSIAKKLFNISGTSLSVVIFGYLCGFPGAAKLTGDLYNKNRISLSDAIRLSTFTNNAGPLFMIGTIGFSILNSAKTGMILLLIQFFSSFCTGLIMCKLIKLPDNSENNTFNSCKKTSFLKNITESISSSFFTMIPITGTIVFFSFLSKAFVASGLLNPLFNILNLNKNLSDGILYSFFELTGGFSDLVTGIKSKSVLIPALTVLCSWSGLSIHMQILNFYSIAKIPVKFYFIGKFLTMILSLFISMLFIRLTT